MNRSLFLISKYVLSNGNLFIESKFILSLSYQEENYCKIVNYCKLCMFYFRCGIELATEGPICFGCGAKKRVTLIVDKILTEREVIGFYFHCGYG